MNRLYPAVNLVAIIITVSLANCADEYRSSMDVMEGFFHALDLRTALYGESSQAPMAWKLIGPRRELTSIISVNGHNIKLPS